MPSPDLIAELVLVRVLPPPRASAPDEAFVDRIAAQKEIDPKDVNLGRLRPGKAGEMPPELESWLRRLGNHRILSRAEECELVDQAQAGSQRARNLMVEHNMRLVIGICRRYWGIGYEYEDLIQEGSLGLVHAIEKFDTSRGIKFSTYATWWVRQYLQRYMQSTGATIRVPARLQDIRRKLNRYMRETPGGTLAGAAEAAEVTYEEAVAVLEGPRVTASLDEPLGDGDDEDGYRLIADPDAVDPAEAAAGLGGHTGVEAALSELTDLQRDVVRMRFGFEGRVMARDEVAKAIGVGPAAVQRAQREGLAMLARILNTEGGATDVEAVFLAYRAVDRADDEERPDHVCRMPPVPDGSG